MITTIALALSIALAVPGQVESRHRNHDVLPGPVVPAAAAFHAGDRAMYLGHTEVVLVGILEGTPRVWVVRRSSGSPVAFNTTEAHLTPIPPVVPAPAAGTDVVPAPPVRYRLADASGQAWEHADPAYLSAWVAARNAQYRPAPTYYHPARSGASYRSSRCASGNCN